MNTQDKIIAEYRKLKRMPSGKWYQAQYQVLKRLVTTHEDELLILLTSGKITDAVEINELACFGMHGGSIALNDNRHWLPMFGKLWAIRMELPVTLRTTLEWLHDTHGYSEE